MNKLPPDCRPPVQGSNAPAVAEGFPIRGSFEDVNVRFFGPGHFSFPERFRNHAKIEFRFHRDRGSDEAPLEVIDEMFRLGVPPIFRMNGERLRAQRSAILLAELSELHLRERVQADHLGGFGPR